MRVALDIDDTITRCPEFFALISTALMAAGHEVYIISYREGREEVAQELAEYGIAYNELFLPTEEDLDRAGLLEWKAYICRRLKIDIFFEDMPEVIKELDESVVAFMPVDGNLGTVTYIDDE